VPPMNNIIVRNGELIVVVFAAFIALLGPPPT
jgi:hypothetical protein